MQYDPIKKIFGNVARQHTIFRRAFYFILGVMFLRTWYVKRALRELLGSKSEPFTMFDAGSGFGQYSYFCATHFPNVIIHAVDVKEEQIDDCKIFFNKMKLNTISFSIEDLTIPTYTNKFDFILSVDVMEHIEDDRKVFQNFAQALRAGGKLLIHTPSNLGGSDVHEEGDRSFVEEHARDGYSVEDITEKLQSAGFNVLYTQYSYGPIGTVAWRLGIKYPLMMLNASKLMFVLLPFYYLFTLWLTLLFMWIDFHTTNTAGTGLMVVAEKK